MKNDYPVEQITPLDAPYNVNVRKGERIIKYKGMHVFADRAYIENGVVYAPVAGGLHYSTGLGSGQVSGIIDSIGAFFSNTWNYITGAQPVGELPDGTKFYSTSDKVYTDYLNKTGLRTGAFTYDDAQFTRVGGGLTAAMPDVAGADIFQFTPQFEQLYARYGDPLSTPGSGLANANLSVPGYAETLATGSATTTPSSGGSIWDGILKVLGIGAGVVASNALNPAQPGNVQTTQPGSTGTSYAELGSQALAVAENALPWVIGAVAAAIIIPSVVGAVTRKA